MVQKNDIEFSDPKSNFSQDEENMQNLDLKFYINSHKTKKVLETLAIYSDTILDFIHFEKRDLVRSKITP